MSVELIVPELGESITEATVSKWLKKIGESFDVDEPLVEIETDKITLEVPAPKAGVLSEIKVQEGKDINIGGVLAIIGESGSGKSVLTRCIIGLIEFDEGTVSFDEIPNIKNWFILSFVGFLSKFSNFIIFP